ncbi:Reverse transcriptase zinc-binding domain [Macleaya cordata]|uniref:Reverse transcriptase zinc-binding domain n=1 Tax=Macleaya cordata TaxID=56857 RepID=A0A200QWG7_MACCD|nr:Reverse transcriptase zinc-binding domain [Macleaya cordata]OVA14782.1 Reverse transcriptase zinc-binding domain [Macleaya cordata]
MHDFPHKNIWNKDIPSKVSFVLWATALGSIPTQDVLRRKGFYMVNRCHLCMRSEETGDHLFLHCKFTSLVWSYFLIGFGENWVMPKTVVETLRAWNVIHGNDKERFVRKVIPSALWWVIWNKRNKRAFDGRASSEEKVIIELKAMIFYWGSLTNIFQDFHFEDLVVK